MSIGSIFLMPISQDILLQMQSAPSSYIMLPGYALFMNSTLPAQYLNALLSITPTLPPSLVLLFSPPPQPPGRPNNVTPLPLFQKLTRYTPANPHSPPSAPSVPQTYTTTSTESEPAHSAPTTSVRSVRLSREEGRVGYIQRYLYFGCDCRGI